MANILKIVFAWFLLFPLITSAQTFVQSGTIAGNIRFTTGLGRLELLNGQIFEGKISYYGGSQPAVSILAPTREMPYYADLVKGFRIFDRQYVAVGNFKVYMGGPIKFSLIIERDFAQLVEVGPLELLIHQAYTLQEDMSSPNGRLQPLQQSSYLLRKSGDFAPIAVINMNSKKDKNLKEILKDLFTSRPDLIEKLKDTSISSENLPAFIHAYNSGQPL